jgi:hypothetical protein
MCNNGAKDNLGQVPDFIWLAICVNCLRVPASGHCGGAASGSYFNIGEVGMRLSGSNGMSASSTYSTIRSFGQQSLVLAIF